MDDNIAAYLSKSREAANAKHQPILRPERKSLSLTAVASLHALKEAIIKYNVKSMLDIPCRIQLIVL